MRRPSSTPTCTRAGTPGFAGGATAGRRSGCRPTASSAFAQNHDQLGNRAKGERLCHLTSVDQAKVAAALVLTCPFVPMLFQGEEFAASAPFQYFADFSDEPDLARAVSEGRHQRFRGLRLESPTRSPNRARPTRSSDRSWTGPRSAAAGHREMLEWHRTLIALRRQLPQLTDGRLDLVSTSFSEADRWLVVERGQVTIVANFADSRRKIPFGERQPRTVLLGTHDRDIDVGPGSVSLPGHSLVILGPEHPTVLDHFRSCTIDQHAPS